MNPVIERLVNEKVEAAFANSEHPKKFFITENGRGVVDGGDLYNAVLNDAVSVMKVALAEVLSEIVSTQPRQQPEPKAAPQTVGRAKK